MALYFDVSAAVHAKAGLSRYAANLARALLTEAPERFVLFYNRSGENQLPAWCDGKETRSVRAGYKPWRMAVWLGHLTGVGFDRLIPGCELFHASEHLLLPLRHCPTVLTVHDLVFLLYPEHHKRLNRWYLNAALPLYCARADAIICVSQHTKEDVVTHWGVDASKIAVVYEAADPSFRPALLEQIQVVRDRYDLPERYLLTVGTVEPRKNLLRLLDALAIVRERGEDVRLVIVGRAGWLYGAFFDRLKRYAHRDAVQWLGYVPDAELVPMYTGATATVLASTYEGFGLPILESMACGTPVVSSAAASLPELGGSAARYFDPLDVTEMAETLYSVWRDDQARRNMAEAGLKRAAGFSWTRAARETMRVYENVGVEIA